MSRLLWTPAAALATALLLTTGTAPAAEKTPPPKLLPGVVYGYVAVPDVGVLKERAGASNIGEMLRDPKLEPTRRQFADLISQASEKVQGDLGVSLDDLKEIPNGSIAFAAAQVETPDGPPTVGMMLLLDYAADQESTVEKLIGKAEAALEGNGAKRTEESFEGTNLVVYTKTKTAAAGDSDGLEDGPETDADPKTETVAWFRKDGRVVLGNGVPVLQAVLARWDGNHVDTFGGDETFLYIAGKTTTDGRPPAFFWYINPVGTVQTAISANPNIPPTAQTALAFLPLLGVTKFKAVGGSVDLATQDYDSVGKVFLYVEQPPTGLLGLFRFPPTDLSPPAWVTKAATGYVGMNWDVAGAYGAVRGLFDQFQGAGALERAIDNAAKNPPNVNAKKDVLDQLTGRIHIANYPIKGAASGAPVQQPAVFAFGVKDEAKAKDLLTRLAKSQGFPGKTREFRGTTIYELPTKNPNGQGPDAVAVAVTNGNLVFSNEIPMIEAIIRGTGGEPLSGSADYKKVAAEMPDQVSWIAFQDQRDQLRTVYEALRAGEVGTNMKLPIDFTKLPPFEDVEQYLQNSGSYAVPDDNGALFVSFTLKGDN